MPVRLQQDEGPLVFFQQGQVLPQLQMKPWHAMLGLTSVMNQNGQAEEGRQDEEQDAPQSEGMHTCPAQATMSDSEALRNSVASGRAYVDGVKTSQIPRHGAEGQPRIVASAAARGIEVSSRLRIAEA